MTLVERWNNYATSLIYIRDENLYTLQYLLQRLMQEASFLKGLVSNTEVLLSKEMLESFAEMPSESLKYAMCVIAAGPMLFVFPFFQKYFSQGLTVGGVKG
jgi:putative aldouronate transport system permease protein